MLTLTLLFYGRTAKVSLFLFQTVSIVQFKLGSDSTLDCSAKHSNLDHSLLQLVARFYMDCWFRKSKKKFCIVSHSSWAQSRTAWRQSLCFPCRTRSLAFVLRTKLMRIFLPQEIWWLWFRLLQRARTFRRAPKQVVHLGCRQKKWTPRSLQMPTI